MEPRAKKDETGKFFCPYCGVELEKLNIKLTEKEEEDFQYYTTLVETASSATSPSVINKLEVTEGEALQYYTAAFDQLAKGFFLKWSFQRDFKKAHNLDKDKDIFIYNGEVYSHGNKDFCR